MKHFAIVHIFLITLITQAHAMQTYANATYPMYSCTMVKAWEKSFNQSAKKVLTNLIYNKIFSTEIVPALEPIDKAILLFTIQNGKIHHIANEKDCTILPLAYLEKIKSTIKNFSRIEWSHETINKQINTYHMGSEAIRNICINKKRRLLIKFAIHLSEKDNKDLSVLEPNYYKNEVLGKKISQNTFAEIKNGQMSCYLVTDYDTVSDFFHKTMRLSIKESISKIQNILNFYFKKDFIIEDDEVEAIGNYVTSSEDTQEDLMDSK